MKIIEKEQRILYSHLIPLSQGVEGLYDFYVPDGSVNALNLKNGKFVYEGNVENLQKSTIPKRKKIGGGLFPK